MIAEIYAVCERLLGATVNGVYQGIIVAVLAGVALRLIRRTNAATRQAVWFGTLLLVAALIPAHLVLDGRAKSPVFSAVTEPTESTTPALFPNDLLDSRPTEFVDAMSSEEASTSVAENIDAYPLNGETVAPQSESEMGALQSGMVQTPVNLPHWIGLCLVSAWLLISEIRVGLIVIQLLEIRRAKDNSRPANAALQSLFDRLRGAGAVRRNVRLRISATQRGPALLGFLHPIIILPAEMETDAHWNEVEVVLRHELAHVNRYDDWANLLQQLIQSSLFFHPAIKWISARLTLEREIACDDHVLEAVEQPRTYALTLTNIASRMTQCRQSLSPGVSSNNSQLKQRINMILNMQRDRSPRLARSRLGFVTSATALLAVLAIVAGPRMVVAESPADSEKGAGALALTAAADDKDAQSKLAKPEGELTPPLPPAGPVAPARPIAPSEPLARAPKAARTLKGPASIEDRLERIERMLGDWEARQGKDSHFGLFSYSDLAAKQAAKESDLENRSKRWVSRNRTGDYVPLSENLAIQTKASVLQLQALRTARESLNRQLEDMDRQIKRLEKQQNAEKPSEGEGSDDSNAVPKPKRSGPLK